MPPVVNAADPNPGVATTSAMSVAVTVPIYKPVLDDPEYFGMFNSLRVLNQRQIYFFAPRGLDLRFYAEKFPSARFVFFPECCFATISDYNKLLMSEEFYELFAPFDYLLVLQPDAVVFFDALDEWTSRGIDYVGAPWPWWEQIVIPQHSPHLAGFRFRLGVGNGGLSLRRRTSCLRVVRECYWVPKTIDINEDLLFSLAGHILPGHRVPGTAEAAQFSLENKPELMIKLGGKTPMGFHAWQQFGGQLCRQWFEEFGFTMPSR